ncbi:MAG: hypothetical protein LBV80_05965 [Deltaproteobacteria bacterium]|jgi:hypothetical protein|nr:hypothetical protein [Deltaproteobacteria bacterium]
MLDVNAQDFDVSAALARDPDGYALRTIKDRLETMKSGLKRTMDKGLPADQFSVANNLHKSCQTAQDLVEQFWSQPRK